MENEVKEANIIYNAIRCPDGTVLESFHRHDYKEYEQGDGRFYSVDGGKEYLSRGFSVQDYEELAVMSDDSIGEIREVFLWTSVLDENSERLPEPVQRKLEDLNDGHIIALVEWTKDDYPDHINEIMVREAQYRGIL